MGIRKTLKRIASFSVAAACMLPTLNIAPSDALNVFAVSDMSAQQITQEMGIGWNLGNTLDAYGGTASGLATETSWGNPKTTKAMIDAVKAKGFNTVRIPTTWFPHLDGSNNINSEWMARVKEVVDYCIDNDMYVILNLHHEDWVDRFDLGTAYNEMQPKFTKVWSQIAEAFKDYDQHLIFESMNEPRAKGTEHEWWGPQQSEVDTINKLNQDFVQVIRSSGSENNKERMLMIPGYCASSDISIISKIQVPSDDMVAVSIHAYVPYDFTMNTAVADHSTYTASYSSSLSQTLENIRSTFTAKGVPVVIGEFGTSNFSNTEARVQWAEQYISTTKQLGIPCVLWDNNVISAPSSAGECHGYLNRSTLTWYPESEPVVDKMIQVMGLTSTEYVPPASSAEDTEEDTSINYPFTISGSDRSGSLTVSFKGTPNSSNNGCIGYAHNGDWEKIEWEGTCDSNGELVINIPLSDIPSGVTGGEIQIWWSSGELEMTGYKTTSGSSSSITEVSAPSTNYNVSGGFHVENQKIIDANGNEFIMRGVNVAHTWYQSYTEQTIKAVAAKGCNTVRVVCADGGQWSKTSADELKKIIGWCKENKLICVVEAHDATGSDNISDVVAAANYWAEMKDILNDNTAYVILNIANEWVGTWDSSTWSQGNQQAIKVIRDAGIKNMIMIDAAGWGQYANAIKEKGAEVFASDPDKNTVFSIHFYGTAGKDAQTIKNNIDGALSSGAPVLAGEFGYNHSDGDVDEAYLMSYCDEKGLGYIAWSWKGNGGGVEYLDLVNDWDGTSLTEWGQIFFGAMTGSKTASVYTGAPVQTTPAATTSTTTTTTTITTTTTTTTIPSTTSTTTAAVSTSSEVSLLGDANVDGKVTIADAVAILQYIANKDKYELKPQGKVNADCFDVGDGITANDALAIQKLDAGDLTALPEYSRK